MATDISICNTALLLAGANQINSLSDSTREGQLCNALYETTKDSLIQKFPWSFTLFQESLSKTSNTPLFDYTYEYQLPVGTLRVSKTDGFGNEYRIMKDKVMSDSTTLQLLYQKDPTVVYYPAYFVRLIELKMAQMLSIALLADVELSREYRDQFLIGMREARGIDSQNVPNFVIDKSKLQLVAIRG